MTVGITNTRLGADKRGIAVELAQRLAIAAASQVCLIGADPTDRDVERRTPQLAAAAGDYSRAQLTRGPHALDIRYMPHHRLCTISMSDRTVLHKVLPDLRHRFRYIIIDGPSRVGSGIGIAHVLLNYLDALIVTTGASAGELAVTRGYIATLDRLASARHVDVRVVISGHPHDSGLSPEQLERRSETLPTIGWLPHLWGRKAGPTEAAHLHNAFHPIVEWIIDHQHGNRPPSTVTSAQATSPGKSPNRAPALSTSVVYTGVVTPNTDR